MVLSVIMYWNLRKAGQGNVPKYVRPIAALDAIPEAVNRAMEMNRPVHGSIGVLNNPLVRVSGGMSVDQFAMVTLLGEAAKLTARGDVELFMTGTQTDIAPIIMQRVEESYKLEGKHDHYSDDMFRYLGNSYIGGAVSLSSMLQRDNVAANIMFGSFSSLTPMIVESSKRAGAVTIGGEPKIKDMPGVVVGADYFVLGEELFAAAATVTRDPETLGNIAGADWGKIFIIVTTLVGMISAFLGYSLVPYLSM
jgi:hypothetical protein